MIATYRIDRRKENILHQMIGDSVNKIIMKSCSDKTNEICLITTLESGENETVDSMQSLQNENGNKINDISHPKNDVRASTERRHRDRATIVTKSSDDEEIECILSHARSTRDRVTTARSSDDEIEQELQLLDSNEFCTTLRLPGRVYEAVEPPDNPKAIIHHSKIDYVEKVEDILGKEEFSLIENSRIGSILKVVKRNRVPFSEELFHFLMQRRVLTQREDLWFTFSDQPVRFSLREFHLTTGLRCEEDQTITEPQFKTMKKPYLWMLGKNDKFTVRTLCEMFKEKARSMPTLERLSLGTAIITEAMAWGKTAYSILMRSVKSLRASSWTGDSYEVSGFALAINLWAMSSVHVLGKSLGKPCETSSSSDPLCLNWDSTKTPIITEVLELEKINNVEVSTVIGLAEEYKHLVGATHSDDADFHSVVKLVQQGYKMRRSDWEKGFVDMFVATEDIEKARSMPTLERLSLGTAIITEAVIMAENPSSKIPRDRLQHYMNYRLSKMAWGKTAYSILMRSVKSLNASSWTGDSYEVSGFALAINLWPMSSVNVLGKSLRKPCETSSSSDPLCLH
ncbi:hypothetical protein F2Q69_00049882 [Brassica cretica]|uniref:DUF1985 domain-containing protein n=1 Tax=Brassica cretica TaxID=69181 RepID=A0A8S9Q4M3_BRACR|nr:hypothetical protein F2Q69_00049882 [Brassica cretica]